MYIKFYCKNIYKLLYIIVIIVIIFYLTKNENIILYNIINCGTSNKYVW